MDGAHRKIELQSPEDLTFLINNVRRAATEHVAAAFPPVEGQDDDAEEDELRVRIEKLVDDYISQTFTLAAPNLSINGFDLDPRAFPTSYLGRPPPSPSPQPPPTGARTRGRGKGRQQQQEDEGPVVQYESFDGRMRLRVEELAREEEDLMREIAALKRRVPAAAARGYADGFRDGVRADEEALARVRAAVSASAAVMGLDDDDDDDDHGNGAGGGGRSGKKGKTATAATTLLDGIGPLERQDDVERGYGGLVEALSRLKRDMPATVAKMERARVAGQYVVTER